MKASTLKNHWPMLLLGAFVACARPQQVALDGAGAVVTLDRPALYPETIEYDRKYDRFLLGSFREGAIYAADRTGAVTTLVDDPRLCSVLGIAVDAERGRVWAANADLGASTKPSSAGPKALAAVGVYDLATGAPAAYVDLAALAPPGPHLLNGVALDRSGNAYVTDSFAPRVYFVDARGNAKVFLEDPRFFSGNGINLNGLVVHPDGYLLMVKKNDGKLFRVPVSAPSSLVSVQLPTSIVGADGVLLVDERRLLVIGNRTPDAVANEAWLLESADGWTSANVEARLALGDSYPTTATVRDGTFYVVQSQLNALIQAPPEQKPRLRAVATLRAIGHTVH